MRRAYTFVIQFNIKLYAKYYLSAIEIYRISSDGMVRFDGELRAPCLWAFSHFH